MKCKASRSYCFCSHRAPSTRLKCCFFLTLFRKDSAHDFNRHFHDDHRIRLHVAALCMRTWKLFHMNVDGSEKTETNLNPLSFQFNSIVTRDPIERIMKTEESSLSYVNVSFRKAPNSPSVWPSDIANNPAIRRIATVLLTSSNIFVSDSCLSTIKILFCRPKPQIYYGA